MKFLTSAPLALSVLLSLASADTVTVEADRDNTLFQANDGSLSNGAGERLFAGVTDSGFLRRALVHFDLSAVPAGSTITSVTLDMRVSKVPFLPPSTDFDMHRVTADWGEGISDAPAEEGAGAPSEDDDATWKHTFYPTDLWTNLGGDFDPTISATTTWTAGNGPISWSSPGLAADVQGWTGAPASNFGWLIKANDEATNRNAKRFNSREFSNPARRPILTVEFDPPTGCSTTVYCDTNPDNFATISIDGCACSSGSINVILSGGPANQFGYLLIGSGMNTLTDPPSALGDMCLIGAAIGRYNKDAALIDGSGNLSTDILSAVTGGGGGGIPNPPGGNICAPPGQTWNFQYWHRNGPAPSRFSTAISVTFR